MLGTDALDEMNLWLDTLSKHQGLRDNDRAAKVEAEILAEELQKAGATTAARVRTLFHHMKTKDGLKFWPTGPEIHAAARVLREAGSGSKPGMRKGGDRNALTFDEQQTLQDRILPTAREWLHVPGLRQHGIQTLEFWGESIEAYREAAE